MKRLIYVVMVVALAAFFVVPEVAAQSFSKPILIGGDTSPTSTSENQKTDATSLEFFIHSQTPAADKNFNNVDSGKIQPDGYDPAYVDDIVASPGRLKGKPITADSLMLDHPKQRAPTPIIDPLNGIGPDDITVSEYDTTTDVETMQGIFGMDLFLNPNGRNTTSHRFVLGDIRVDDGGDWLSLFPDPWLEAYPFGGIDYPIIGDAAEHTPYVPNEYPASIINADIAPAPYMWCVVLPVYNNPISGYTGCDWKLSENKYSSVFLYDFADVGNGFVAPSYDPLALNVKGQGYKWFPSGGDAVTLPSSMLTQQTYSYFSPLTLFRKQLVGGTDYRYRLAGYTSWYLPDMVEELPSGQWQLHDLWQFVVTNFIVPFAMNPISVGAINLDGASYDVANPATDVAVTYQNTLFDLDGNVFDIFGRPTMAGSAGSGYLTYRDIIGTCATSSCSAFESLTEEQFPDNILSFLLFWRQKNKWHEGEESTGTYETMNPSHVFEPTGNDAKAKGAFVGPGVYHTAVMTDFAGNPAARREMILVPSTEVVADDGAGCVDCSPIYVINPDAEENLWLRVPHLEAIDTTATPPTASYDANFVQIPLALPKHFLLKRPDVPAGDPGYVPYEIRTGNIDGDECEDILVTWRGRDTKEDTANPGKVVFVADSTDRMFSEVVTIVRREESGGSCDRQLPRDYPLGYDYGTGKIPPYLNVVGGDGFTGPLMATVPSADIGDFNGDGKNDIVAGNLDPVNDTAYAYVYWNGPSPAGFPFTDFIFSPMERTPVRVGFHEGTDAVGAGLVRADRMSAGANAIASINGRPLMLPEIGCPDNATPAATPVGGTTETYVSTYTNMSSAWAGANYPSVYSMKTPFTDAGNSPIPQRCATLPDKCSAGGYDLPLYADDPCCMVPCDGGMTASAYPSACHNFIEAYVAVSGEAFNYAMAWHMCDPVGDPWVSNESFDNEELNRAFAGADDRGEGGNGGSDYAAREPDRVIEDGHGAIAVASALENAVDAPALKTENLKAVQPSLFGTPVPLEGILMKALQFGDRDSELLARLKEDGSLKKLEVKFNKYLAESAYGGPRSFEDIYIRSMIGAALVSVDHVNAMKDDKANAGTAFGRCSLAVEGSSIDLSGLFRTVRSAASWVWDLIVPDAGAGYIPVCGNGTIDTASGEVCDPGSAATNDVCGAGEICLGNDAIPATEKCHCVKCGDGTVQSGTYWMVFGVTDAFYDEPCDPAATPDGCTGGESCTSSCECEMPTAVVPDGGFEIAPFCGDGAKNGTEECDPTATPTGCDPGATCQPVGDPDQCTCEIEPYTGISMDTCGDNVVNVAGETCDNDIPPGTGVTDSGCAALGNACRISTAVNGCTCCGDGYKQAPTEDCDPNASGASGMCSTGAPCPDNCQCTTDDGTCGDGTIDPGETCDPAAALPAGCSSCRPASDPDAPCTCCGDGIEQNPPEQCDNIGLPCLGGSPTLICQPDCTCLDTTTGGGCGDGIIDAGEECGETGLDCDPGEMCVSCLCLDFNSVKLPMGQLMPEHREMTAVLLMFEEGTSLNVCNPPDGTKDPGEECDMWGWPDPVGSPGYEVEVNKPEQCGPPSAGAKWSCEINCICVEELEGCPPAAECTSSSECEALHGLGWDCTLPACVCEPPDYTGCPPGSECTSSSECGPEQWCEPYPDCTCHDFPPGTGDDTPGDEALLQQTYNDCYVSCLTFSGEAEKEIFTRWNEEARGWSGRNDDLFCEPEQKFSIICRIGAASAPGVADLSLSLSGTPLPDSSENLRPYMWIQESGSEFVDITTFEFKDYVQVDTPMRILPVEGIDPATQVLKAVVLPDLSMSADLIGLEGIVPMATSSVIYGAGGSVQVNNMIEHKVYSVMPGQEFSVVIGGSAQTIKAQAVDIPENAAIAIQEVKAVMSMDCASWTQTEGFKECPNIEDRQFSAEAIQAAIEANKAAFAGTPTSAIYKGLPWEPNLNYNFTLIQSIYGEVSEAEPVPVELGVGTLGGKPLSMGKGGGCGCYVANGSASLGSIAPFVMIMILPIGVAVGAIRRRWRRK